MPVMMRAGACCMPVMMSRGAYSMSVMMRGGAYCMPVMMRGGAYCTPVMTRGEREKKLTNKQTLDDEFHIVFRLQLFFLHY